MVPSSDESFLEIARKPLVLFPIEPLPPEEERKPGDSGRPFRRDPSDCRTLPDMKKIRRRIDDLIIWPEKHRKMLRPMSRSSGSPFLWAAWVRKIAMGKGNCG